jgi:hypothetical protein
LAEFGLPNPTGFMSKRQGEQFGSSRLSAGHSVGAYACVEMVLIVFNGSARTHKHSNRRRTLRSKAISEVGFEWFHILACR